MTQLRPETVTSAGMLARTDPAVITKARAVVLRRFEYGYDDAEQNREFLLMLGLIDPKRVVRPLTPSGRAKAAKKTRQRTGGAA